MPGPREVSAIGTCLTFDDASVPISSDARLGTNYAHPQFHTSPRDWTHH